ncbi:MAG: hypothetical protein GDA47_01970 [Rhodospirillales bacterium]|nr:hypothetical protein [Rhodospirillales bacterium]
MPAMSSAIRRSPFAVSAWPRQSSGRHCGVSFAEIADDAARFHHHAIDPIMAVHALEQEALDAQISLLHRLGVADEAGDLRHLQRMRQPGSVVVALVVDEDLGLVLQSAKGIGRDNAIAIALKDRAGRALRRQAAARPVRAAGYG